MRIPLEALPSTPDFFLNYVRNWETVSSFFPHDYSLESVRRFAEECVAIPPDRRERLAAALQSQQEGWGASFEPVEKLGSGAVAVVAGQQAGLFTGPLYSVLKALTAVKIARELEARGVAAVPVFWIASDDHDYQEIEWAGILNGDSRFKRIEAKFVNGDSIPAGWLRFTSAIAGTIQQCFESLPASEFHDDVRALIESAYRPDTSPVDAFGRMMTRLFEGTGLVLVDPLDPELRSLSEPVLDEAARNVSTIRSAVLERSRRISEAGYREQVRVDDSFTGLFAYEGVSRKRLLPAAGPVPSSKLSPDVLLRPLVQDSLFPTAAYVGGPAEVAYFAQAGAIYECLEKPMPPVFPRITATLIEPPVARILKKFDLRVEDVFQGADRLRKLAAGSVYDVSAFRDVRQGVADQTESLRSVLTGVDKTLEGALNNSIQKIVHQIDSLQSRFVNAESRRNEILERQLGVLTHRLYPERKLQERVVNVTSFLVRYGMNLVPLMDARLDLDGSVHQVVEL